MAETKRADVLKYLENANMMEISDLIGEIEEKFGVSAAAPVAAVAAAPVADGGSAGDEKDEFDVMLTSAGSSKINVIKVVRTITGLGLKEAKEFLKMCSNLSKNINKDLENGIVAKWHDESHMNRWRIDNPPSKILDCGYCYQESLFRPHKPKILALDKNHAQLRS